MQKRLRFGSILTGLSSVLLSISSMALLLTAFTARAQDKAEKKGDNVVYKKTTEFSFEDDTIEGDLTKPDGEYVEARKRVKHSNLIKIREEFKDKVMQSVGEL